MRRVSRSRGFTLIEVLVALVIVAVGMAALMGALTSSANTVSYMRDRTFAEWVALNQLATLRLQMQPGQVPPAGNTNGDLDYAGRKWHWRQDVIATQVQGIMRIDMKVRPADVKAGDDSGWFVTVMGLVGDAVAAPKGTLPTWGGVPSGGTGGRPSGGQPGTPGNPGVTPRLGNPTPSVPTPTPTPNPTTP